MKKSLAKKVITLSAVLSIAATAFSTHTFAEGTSVNTTIQGGELSGGDISFSPISAELKGSKTTESANWTISNIIDARGTGDGWKLSLALTEFKEVDTNGEYIDSGYKLDAGSLTVTTAPTIDKSDLSSSDHTVISTILVDTALDGATVDLVTAESHEGMGSYKVTDLGVTLTIPANAYAKTYKTDATLTLGNDAP